MPGSSSWYMAEISTGSCQPIIYNSSGLLQVYGPGSVLFCRAENPARPGPRKEPRTLYTTCRPPVPAAPGEGSPPCSHTHHHVFILEYVLATDFAEQLPWEVQVMLRNKFKNIVPPARARENQRAIRGCVQGTDPSPRS